MKLTSYGDLASSYALQRRTLATKLEVQRLSTEATTGQASNLAEHLGGSYGQLTGIESSLARLNARQSLGASTTVVAEAMQTVLSTVDSVASDYAASLMAATSSAQSAQLPAVLKNGETQFETVVSALNTQFSGRSLFAGKDTQNAALAGANEILSQLEMATAGLQSAADVQAAITGWFESPSGYDALAYKGGAALEPIELAVGFEADFAIDAKDPALKSTLQGLAMAALLGRGLLAGDRAQQSALGRAAGETLLSAQADRTQLAARLGTAQGAIESARTRNASEIAALELARVDLVEIDPYEAATRLEAAQTQLETIYSITSRLSNLSLLDFLR